METNFIQCADAFKFSESIPDESIDLVLANPPSWGSKANTEDSHELGQERSLEDYLQKLWRMMYDLIRITKSTGHIVININDKQENYGWLLIPYRFAMEIADEDCRLLNIINWVKKNNIQRQYKNKLLPSVEPFFHFIKSNDYYYNIQAYQRKRSEPGCLKRPNSNIGQKYFPMIKLSSLTDEQKSLAESELKVAIDEVKEGKIQSFRMKIKGIHAIGTHRMYKKGFTLLKYSGNTAIKRDVIESSVEFIKGVNQSIFPEKLVRELLYLLTQPNDIIFDPFCGFGTTCLVAKKMNRRYIGIDLNESYVKKAKERLD
jgi:DNA modification methylase